MILGSVGVGLAALAKRLVKLAPRLVLTSFPIHRARHLLDRARQGLHFVAQSFDVEEQRVLRPRELVDGRAQALELIAHSGQGRLDRGVGGRPWVGSGHGRKLGLGGEESFVAIGANGKWQRRRRKFRRRWFA
jgi:hypothetical protein